MQLAGEWVPYIGLHCLSIWKTKCRSKSKDINNQTHCQKQESLLKHKYIHSKITSAFVLSAQLVFRYVLIKHTLYLITSNDSAVYTSAGVHSTTFLMLLLLAGQVTGQTSSSKSLKKGEGFEHCHKKWATPESQWRKHTTGMIWVNWGRKNCCVLNNERLNRDPNRLCGEIVHDRLGWMITDHPVLQGQRLHALKIPSAIHWVYEVYLTLCGWQPGKIRCWCF